MNIEAYPYLTYKQQVFCSEYLIDLNATRAALKAGYSVTTALSGYLMTMPKIKMHLKQQQAYITLQMQINHKTVLQELGKIAFANMRNYIGNDGKVKPLNEIGEDDHAALNCITMDKHGTVRVKMSNKLAALEKIAKHLNFYNNREEEHDEHLVYLNHEQMTEDDRFDDELLEKEIEIRKLQEERYERYKLKLEEDGLNENQDAKIKAQDSENYEEGQSLGIADMAIAHDASTGAQHDSLHTLENAEENAGLGQMGLTTTYDASTGAQHDSVHTLENIEEYPSLNQNREAGITNQDNESTGECQSLEDNQEAKVENQELKNTEEYPSFSYPGYPNGVGNSGTVTTLAEKQPIIEHMFGQRQGLNERSWLGAGRKRYLR